MITPHHRIIMLIIRQIRRRHPHLQLAPIDINLDLALKVRRIDDRDCHGAVRVLKGADVQRLSAAGGLDADGAGAREAEVSGEGVEAAGYFDGVAAQADEDGVAAGGGAGGILGAPPVEVAGCVGAGEGVVPGYCVSLVERL